MRDLLRSVAGLGRRRGLGVEVQDGLGAAARGEELGAVDGAFEAQALSAAEAEHGDEQGRDQRHAAQPHGRVPAAQRGRRRLPPVEVGQHQVGLRNVHCSPSATLSSEAHLQVQLVDVVDRFASCSGEPPERRAWFARPRQTWVAGSGCGICTLRRVQVLHKIAEKRGVLFQHVQQLRRQICQNGRRCGTRILIAAFNRSVEQRFLSGSDWTSVIYRRPIVRHLNWFTVLLQILSFQRVSLSGIESWKTRLIPENQPRVEKACLKIVWLKFKSKRAW